MHEKWHDGCIIGVERIRHARGPRAEDGWCFNRVGNAQPEGQAQLILHVDPVVPDGVRRGVFDDAGCHEITRTDKGYVSVRCGSRREVFGVVRLRIQFPVQVVYEIQLMFLYIGVVVLEEPRHVGLGGCIESENRSFISVVAHYGWDPDEPAGVKEFVEAVDYKIAVDHGQEIPAYERGIRGIRQWRPYVRGLDLVYVNGTETSQCIGRVDTSSVDHKPIELPLRFCDRPLEWPERGLRNDPFEQVVIPASVGSEMVCN